MNSIGGKIRSLEGGSIAYWCPGCKCGHILLLRTPFTGSKPSWVFDGNYLSPTITPSVHVQYWEPIDWDNELGPKIQRSACHAIITNGQIQFLLDCEHELAGQTVELPFFDAHVRNL